MMMIANGARYDVAHIVLCYGKSATVGNALVFTGTSFQMVTVPIAAMFLVLLGSLHFYHGLLSLTLLCLRVCGITARLGIFMMMVVGGGFDAIGTELHRRQCWLYEADYIVPLICMAYMFFYSGKL